MSRQQQQTREQEGGSSIHDKASTTGRQSRQGSGQTGQGSTREANIGESASKDHGAKQSGLGQGSTGLGSQAGSSQTSERGGWSGPTQPSDQARR